MLITGLLDGMQYAAETACLFANQLLDGATADMTVAVVSTPSVFVALKNIMVSAPLPSDTHPLRYKKRYADMPYSRKAAAPADQPKPKVVLLEHDNRFAVFPEFVYYDFAQPLKLPAELKGACDRIVVDPPFLSEDCQTKGVYLPPPYSASPHQTSASVPLTTIDGCTPPSSTSLRTQALAPFPTKPPQLTALPHFQRPSQSNGSPAPHQGTATPNNKQK